MGRTDYLWFQASGPCRDRWIVEAPGPAVRLAHVDAAHEDSGEAASSGPFSDLGAVSRAAVFTNVASDMSGRFTVLVAGPCNPGPCPPAATVSVTVRSTGARPDSAATK